MAFSHSVPLPQRQFLTLTYLVNNWQQKYSITSCGLGIIQQYYYKCCMRLNSDALEAHPTKIERVKFQILK
ncbi:MAG: hypothetical protein ACLBM1_00725 [Cuspidothrix sp.]